MKCRLLRAVLAGAFWLSAGSSVYAQQCSSIAQVSPVPQGHVQVQAWLREFVRTRTEQLQDSCLPALFSALRDAEASDSRTQYDDVLLGFWNATNAAPRNPEAWLGFGVAKLQMWHHGWVAKTAPYHFSGSYLGSGVRSVVKAMRLSPYSVDGALILGVLLLDPELERESWLREYEQEVLAVLRSRAGTASSGASLLVWGRTEAEFGDPRRAVEVLTEYASLAGASGAGLLALAEAQFSRGEDLAGARSYFVGAAHDDPEAIAAYRSNLSLIADSAEMADFDRAGGAARVAFLRGFWSRRDEESLRRVGERLPEHFRRLAVARKRYRLPGLPRRFDSYERHRPAGAEFDDRGITYIRHGEPDAHATAVGNGACYNESWLYRRPGGNMVLHFLARTDPHDWRLVETIYNIGGGRGASNRLQLHEACPPVPDLVASREALDPIYSRLRFGGSRRLQEQELEIVRRSLAQATTSDSYELRFDRVLEPVVQVFGMPERDGQPAKLLVVFAVPAEQLESTDSSAGWVYPLHMRVVAVDRTTSAAFRADTARQFVTRARLDGKAHLVGFLEVPAASGNLDVGVVMEQEASRSGQAVRITGIDIDEPRSRTLTASDVVLGDAASGLLWHRGGTAVPLNPLNTFVANTSAVMYTELAGLMPGRRYTMRVQIRPLDGTKRGGGVTLRFTQVANAPRMQIIRSIVLQGLAPGSYLLRLSVGEDAENPALVREQRLNIVVDEAPR